MFWTAPEPPNGPATVDVDARHHTIEIRYNDRLLFEGKFSAGTRVEVVPPADPEKVEQTIAFTGASPSLDGTVTASTQAFAAETMGNQEARFPVVRNSDGPSYNLRNNAVYDREEDTLLAGPTDGATVITPEGPGKFSLRAAGPNLRLVFSPRYYQKHKNIAYFQPWKRPLKRESIAGWCSWWAYRSDIDEDATLATASAFAERLKDFGFDIIQLDDGYESAEGAPPGYWLKTNSKFPEGLGKLARQISAKGLRPGIWVGTQIFDKEVTEVHPGWFVRDADGKAHKGPWIGYGVDGSKPAALKAMFRPVFDAFHKDGFSYVKIDSLRHLLYDSLYPCRDQMLAEGVKPEDAFRDYLEAAREELGDDTYILACWGVLPEAAGIVDACRLGGDGFGPSTLLQYNSWNNVVWRNDPDHVDISGEGEDIIRPTLVSMAGAQLLLSDRAQFYERGDRLEGAKRAAPIPFTLPGQLYDFDPAKTDNLISGLRNQNGGSNAGPLDADQHGPESPWWQLDICRPFERWTVLARLSWKPQQQQQVSFSELGLPSGRYAVYEFWSHRYLGEFDSGFSASEQPAKGASVYCIRRVEPHPQVISTSRHITQGGPDLVGVQWNPHEHTLSGLSRVVRKDPYKIAIRTAGLQAARASHPLSTEDGLAILTINPSRNGEVSWWIKFRR